MNHKRIVIKVGTNVLTDENGQLDLPVFHQIVTQIAILSKKGWSIVLVSSGAVGAGNAVLKTCDITDETIKRQVLSSIGQANLMKIYFDLFSAHNMICSQVLATKEDFSEGDHYHNMVNCFEGLLSQRIIPIVNENDVVSLIELMFTDNDELAGLTAKMIGAKKLLLLTNVDGFYNGSPEDTGTEIIHEVKVSSDSVEAYVDITSSSQGRGGMSSKLKTGIRATKEGIETHIAAGKKPNVIIDIIDGKPAGTKFVP